ncbi:putative leader peptide [Streptomyces sp. NPDC001135]
MREPPGAAVSLAEVPAVEFPTDGPHWPRPTTRSSTTRCGRPRRPAPAPYRTAGPCRRLPGRQPRLPALADPVDPAALERPACRPRDHRTVRAGGNACRRAGDPAARAPASARRHGQRTGDPAVPVDRVRPVPPLPHRAGPHRGNTRTVPQGGNNRGRPRVETHDEIREAVAHQARPARRTEVTAVPRALPLPVPCPYRSVRLTSRPHIDLQRVSAALCRH